MAMNTVAEIEKVILALAPAERERIATVVWDSLADDLTAASDLGIDAEGIAVASQRDAEMELGRVKSVDHDAFLQRTGGRQE